MRPPAASPRTASRTRQCFAAAVLAWLAVAGEAQPAPEGDLAEVRARAERADPEAQNALGNAYTSALFGLKQDYAEALKWYRRAAENGFAPAFFNLGLAYELGRGVRSDPKEAFRYYLRAAEQGFAAAQFNIGNMYSAGRGVGQDYFEAQFNLGLAYETGRGVKKDEEEEEEEEEE